MSADFDPLRDLFAQDQAAGRRGGMGSIVAVSDGHDRGPAPGFEDLDEAIRSVALYMTVAAEQGVACRDVALFRDGRLLAVVRRGAAGAPDVTVFGATGRSD